MGEKKLEKTIKNLSEQLEHMEARLAAVEQRLDEAAITGTAPSDAITLKVPSVSSAPAAGAIDGEARETNEPAVDTTPDEEPPRSPLWALKALKAQLPDRGGVVYAVAATVDRGRFEYQWGRPTEHLLAQDWSELANPLNALGHPLRLAILRLLLEEDRTVAQLVDLLHLGSSGIAYHHLSALQAGGWVTSPQRGAWSIPPARTCSLLTIITALEAS